MYRRKTVEQLKLEMPFGVQLDTNNRWVKLAEIMPWEKIEEGYGKNFKGEKGQVAKSGRLAFAALYIQGKLTITDEETVAQIQENPSMQFFCGFEEYSPEQPFDASLMVHFRKRITAEMMKEITEEAFVAEARKAIEKEEKGSDKSDKTGNDEKDTNGGTDDNNDTKDPEVKGTLLLDASCCPSDIHYPTDVHLLNHAREITEEVIDKLHEWLLRYGYVKPRTYRETARRAYLSYAKKRKHTKKEVRFSVRAQLQYVRRNLDSIAEQIECGAPLSLLDNDLYGKLLVVTELYRQQKQMYDDKTHSIEDRIVSISQPHIRPIVRGKTNAPVEFGAKVATAHVGGFTFIINLGYDNFSESQYLEASAEEYKRIFGFYPKKIIGDRAYATNDNRKYCESKHIRLSAPKRGRKSEEVKEEERKQLYRDGCIRNAVESDYGVVKRKYGLDLVMTKLYETTLTAISFGFFVKNMERLLRLLVLLFVIKMVINGSVRGLKFA